MNCAEKLLEPTIFFNLYTYKSHIYLSTANFRSDVKNPETI